MESGFLLDGVLFTDLKLVRVDDRTPFGPVLPAIVHPEPLLRKAFHHLLDFVGVEDCNALDLVFCAPDQVQRIQRLINAEEEMPRTVANKENGPDQRLGSESQQSRPHVDGSDIVQKGHEHGLGAAGIVIDQKGGHPVFFQAAEDLGRGFVLVGNVDIVVSSEMGHQRGEQPVLGVPDHDQGLFFAVVQGQESGQELPGAKMSRGRHDRTVVVQHVDEQLKIVGAHPMMHKAMINGSGEEQLSKGTACMHEALHSGVSGRDAVVPHMPGQSLGDEPASGGQHRPDEASQG